VVLEYVLEGEVAWGTRLHADGRVEELVAPEPGLEPEPAWRARAQLDPAAVATVREAIQTTGYLDLPARLGAPGNTYEGRTIRWAATIGDRGHVVVAVGAGARHPVLEALREAFERQVADALLAEADDEPEVNPPSEAGRERPRGGPG
jgi:hypothetical protein